MSPDRVRAVSLSSDRLDVALWGDESAPVIIAHVHGNEQVALHAAAQVVGRRPVRLVGLAPQPRRRQRIRVAGRLFDFDPNRMWTLAGRAATLACLGGDAQPTEREQAAALADLADYAERAWHLLGAGQRPIVAAHNNADGLLPVDALLGEPATLASCRIPHLPTDDFLYVCHPPAYERLTALPFAHAVLRDDTRAPDDGSLSVRCAHEGVPYINVECHPARGDRNRDLLLAAVDALLPR
ncbi:MAG: hypothetical protein KC613_09095 [Myxococcales bacterium]|nr:hypothetical protein [Myxococcales bacterium]